VLQDAGAIRECEEHGWMQDRADPHAGQRALEMAKQEWPSGLAPEHALAEIGDVLKFDRRHLPLELCSSVLVPALVSSEPVGSADAAPDLLCRR
jgi:hypothetical protein